MNRLCAWVTRNCTFQNALVAGLLLTLAAFLGVLFSEWIETKISGQLDIAKKSDILKFVGIAMGGILVALQALMSYKRAVALENTANAQADAANAQSEAAKAQAMATEEQASANRLTEEGQRQERMKNAIEHLGHKSDSVRLGGAYELFHFAEDAKSAKDSRTLRQNVLDILCAHIRQTTGEDKYQQKHHSKPSVEVQSVMSLLFVQKHDVFERLTVDLRGSWLRGVELRKSRLEEAILREANLRNADLIGARLNKAVLARAQLQGAILRDANMREAKLHSVSFHKAILNGVCLQGAHLIDARLEGVDLCGVRLEAANLDHAFLLGANLSGAHLQESYLCGAKLQGANLADARLQGASLNTTSLHGAYLARAQLQSAHLAEAELRGVRCRGSFPVGFAERIRQSIGNDSDLSTVVFEGGLTRGDVERLVEHILDVETADVLRMKLTPHIGKLASDKLPDDCGAIAGSYTEEEAEEWIAEYEEAMSGIQGDDS